MDPESSPDPAEKEPNSDRSSHLAYSHHANSDEEGLVKQIEDRIHDLDHNELLHLRDLLSGTLNKIEFRLLETSESVPLLPTAAASKSSSNLYRCLLCGQGAEYAYWTKDTFKQHVENEHVPRYEIYCPKYTYITNQKDIYLDHLRQHDLEPGKLRVRPLSTPSRCWLCSKKVTSWNEFFHCIANHCCFHTSDYASGDDSGSDSGTVVVGSQFMDKDTFSTANSLDSLQDRRADDDCEQDNYSEQTNHITTNPTDVNADDYALPFLDTTRFKADLHDPQSADAPSTGEAASFSSTPIDTTRLEYGAVGQVGEVERERQLKLQHQSVKQYRQRQQEVEKREYLRHQEHHRVHRQPGVEASIDSGADQDDGLEFLLNPAKYYGKLEELEVDTALECGIDRIFYHPPGEPEPYSTISECIQALSRCVDAFLNLQKEGFCERVFTILVEDPSRQDVAKAVHVSLENIKTLVVSL